MFMSDVAFFSLSSYADFETICDVQNHVPTSPTKSTLKKGKPPQTTEDKTFTESTGISPTGSDRKSQVSSPRGNSSLKKTEDVLHWGKHLFANVLSSSGNIIFIKGNFKSLCDWLSADLYTKMLIRPLYIHGPCHIRKWTGHSTVKLVRAEPHLHPLPTKTYLHFTSLCRSHPKEESQLQHR